MQCPYLREWEENGCEAGERLVVIDHRTVNRFCVSGSYRICPHFGRMAEETAEGLAVLD